MPARLIEVRSFDDSTDQPLPATIELPSGELAGPPLAEQQVAGVAPGSVLIARAEGYQSTSLRYLSGGDLEARLRPLPRGRVLDARTGRPLGGALVAADGATMATDDDGRFQLATGPPRLLRVVAAGYRRLELASPGGQVLDLRLEPFEVRGLYLSTYGVADRELRENALRLLRTTEANTLVLDVKGDRGTLSYRSQVPLAAAIGANDSPTLPDVESFVTDMHRQGYYLIARIVVFKDDLLARNGPRAGLDVSIKDRATGRAWQDGEGLAWTDPFRQEVWQYNVDLAREAARLGFDEVQLDYVRFPSDPSTVTSVSNAVYSQESTEQSRVAAISSFLERMGPAIWPLGALLSADIFGFTCWQDGDLGIGQRIADIAPHVDFISPMVYPSTFAGGLPGGPGYPEVIDHPRQVVLQSMLEAARRMEGSGAQLRPWLQYFDDYPWATGRPYTEPYIVAQKQASVEAGTRGWMLWDPSNRYDRGGLQPR